MMLSASNRAPALSAGRGRKAPCQSLKSTRAASIRSAQRAGCGAAALSLPLRSRSILPPFFFCAPCPGPFDTKQVGRYQAVGTCWAGGCFHWKHLETRFGNKVFLQFQALIGAVSSVSNSSRARHAKRARACARTRVGQELGNNGNNGNKLNKTLRYKDNPVSKLQNEMETLGNKAASPVGEWQNSAVSNKIGRGYRGVGADRAEKGFSLALAGEKFRTRVFDLVAIGRLELLQGASSSSAARISIGRSGGTENGGFPRLSGLGSIDVGTAMLERTSQSLRNARFAARRCKLGRLTGAALGARAWSRGVAPPGGRALSPSPASPEAGRILIRPLTRSVGPSGEGAQIFVVRPGPGAMRVAKAPRSKWGRGCQGPDLRMAGSATFAAADLMRRESSNVK